MAKPDETASKKNIDQVIQEDVQNITNKPKKDKLSFTEYLALVGQDPKQALMAHARIHDMIAQTGYDEIRLATNPRIAKLFKLGPEDVCFVPKFFKGFFGVESVLQEVDKFFFAAAGGGEESRQVLYLLGPVGAGKSTLAENIRQGLERYGFWEIEDCDNHDNPLNATPRHLRSQLLKDYGIYVHPRADICPQCRWHLKNELSKDYRNFNAVWRTYSERNSRGIAIVSEVNPINFDIGVLIGSVDISKIERYPDNDPRVFSLHGAYNQGNGGVVEFVEIFKNPPEAIRTLITATQEKYVPSPKMRGRIYIDTVFIAHSNEADWNKFKADMTNEAIGDRIKTIRVPYNLRLNEEVQIYKESFLGRSSFRNIHIDPHALEQVALFALSTRITKSDRCELLIKLKCYNGEEILESGKVQSIDIDELRQEAGWQEGMVGISYREAEKEIIEECLALHRHEWVQDKYLRDRGGYLNAIWIRDAMVRYIMRAQIPEDAEWPKPSRKRWLEFVKTTLHQEYLNHLENDLTRSLIEAFEEKAEDAFQCYLDHVVAYVNDKKVKDQKTGEEREPNKKELADIEQHIGVTDARADAFRQGVAAALMDLMRNGQKISYKSYLPLREAIENKIKSTMRKTARILLKTRVRDEKDQEKYDQITEQMKKLGYAEYGIEIYLAYADNNLSRD